MGPADTSGLPRLSDAHTVSGFQSGATELDDWLRHKALRGQRSGNAATYVATKDGRVLGYYALAAGGCERRAAPGSVARNSPDPVPVLLIARLAVDQSVQGRGLGRRLLSDALQRCAKVSLDVGFRAVLIHARDQTAIDFYRAHADFVTSPTDANHLFLRVDQLQRAAFGEQSR